MWSIFLYYKKLRYLIRYRSRARQSENRSKNSFIIAKVSLSIL